VPGTVAIHPDRLLLRTRRRPGPGDLAVPSRADRPGGPDPI